MMDRRSCLITGFALAFASAVAQGQETGAYPSKPIRFIVPFPPGGPSDVLSRIIGRKLSVALGQQVIVDNRPGGGTTIGANLVAKSAPDGHTLLLASTPFAINPSLYKSLPYDTATAFVPVAQITQLPGLLVVPSELPVKTLADLTALARQKPGHLNYASAGNGSFPHLVVELYKHQAGVSITHIPYAGMAPALMALLARDVQLVAVDIPSALPHLTAGTIKALAVSTSARLPSLPEIPTVAESGLTGYSAMGWHGIMVSAGTPAAIVERVNAEVNNALRDPELRELLTAQGLVVAGGTAQQFADFVKADTQRWRSAVASSGARVD